MTRVVGWKIALGVVLAATIGLSAGPAIASDLGRVALANQTKTQNGCTVTAVTPWKDNNKISFRGTATCTTTATRTLSTSLWHWYEFFPSIVTKAGSPDSGTKRSYVSGATTCDNGGTTTYYTEAIIRNSSGTILVYVPSSGNAEFSHC